MSKTITTIPFPPSMEESEKTNADLNGGKKTDTFSQALERLRRKLLDLSRRNRLLNFRLTKRNIQIVDEQPSQVFDYMVSQNKPMIFEPLPEPKLNDEDYEATGPDGKQTKLLKEEIVAKASEQAGIDISKELPGPYGNGDEVAKKHADNKLQTRFFPSELEKRLHKISSTARSLIEESGINQLFIALGFLEWYDSPDSTESNLAPLILIPVETNRRQTFDRKIKTFRYEVIYTGEDLFPNLTLSEKLKELGLVLPEFDEELDPEPYYEEVRQAIASKPRWKVRRHLVLGFFTFTKLLMYHDLDPKLWDGDGRYINRKLIEDFLLGYEYDESHSLEEYDIEEDNFVSSLMLPLDADSSQHTAIADVIKGKNLVIDGPPGTGKSQTITNIIAAALAQNKTILFVAEKLAALKVVKRNLDRAGIGDFCLELHSHKAQKKRILSNIKSRLNRRYSSAADLEKVADRRKKIVKQLKEYLKLIHSHVQPTDEAIYDIFWKRETFRPSQILPADLGLEVHDVLAQEDIQAKCELLESLVEEFRAQPEPSENCWLGFMPSALIYGDEGAVQTIIDRIISSIHSIQTSFEDINSRVGSSLSLKQSSLDNLEHLIDLSHQNAPELYNKHALRYLLLGDNKDRWNLMDNFVSKLSEYNKSLDIAAHLNQDVKSLFHCDLSGTLDALGSLGRVGKDLRINNLPDAIDSLQTLITWANELDSLCNALPERYQPSIRNRGLIENAVKIAKAVINKPPLFINEDALKLFQPKARDLYQKGNRICSELLAEQDQLNELFVFDNMPCADELKNLCVTLRMRGSGFLSLLHGDYRAAIRHIRSFYRNPKKLKRQRILAELDNLVRHQKRVRNYEDDDEYEVYYGTLFKGLDTKWDNIHELVEWSNNLTILCGDAELAQTYLHETPPVDIIGSTEKGLVALNNQYASVQRYCRAGVFYQSDDLTRASMNDLIRDVNDLIKSLKLVHNKFEALPLPSTEKDISTLSEELSSAINVKAIHDELSNNDVLSDAVGPKYTGADTDLKSIENTIAYAQRITDAHLHRDFLNTNVDFIEDLLRGIADNEDELSKNIETIDSSNQELGSLYELNEAVFYGGRLQILSLEALNSKMSVCKGSIARLVKWADYCRLRQQACKKGLSSYVEAMEGQKLRCDNACDYYLYNIYDYLARKVLGENEKLSQFSRSQHEKKRNDFKKIDKEYVQLIGERIAYTASQKKPPTGVSRGPVREWTDAALLNHEIKKQRAHIPMRQLVRRAGNALRTIKPCFMMSPMSVAQFLPLGEFNFDLMIVDEASQVLTQESIGAIGRCQQIVVVGDPNQLPPTTFFTAITETVDDNVEEETCVEDAESVLDACLSANMPKRRLKWHYRSEHESLIAFSNSQFYDNELVLFPSPDDSRSKLGIRYHYVPGATYSGSRNRKEAEYVANAVAWHARNCPELSLGVGTFNIQQRELIDDCLERLRKKDPDLDDALIELDKACDGNEPLIIKNLENLQGDERDVIIISCTFGPDKNTRVVYQRFGPINYEHGWRRLNVMFSRAKKRMEVYSSMRSEDIVGGSSSSRGANALKNFLKYAETGLLPEAKPGSGGGAESPFEEAVCRVLSEYGHSAVNQVGVAGYFIDIAIKNPRRQGEYLLGVECDGATYHSAKSVRERDRLREEVLRRRGWNIYRIWSTDWFKNRDGEIQRLLAHIEKCDDEDKRKITTTLVYEDELIEEPTIEDKPTSKEMLRHILIDYGKNNIAGDPFDGGDGILRKELLDLFVDKRPIDKADFRQKIPEELRTNINRDQRQHLDDILEIIEGSVV